MKQPQKPLWKKSIIQDLNLYDITNWLEEISDNGDMYGYERGDEGYYNDYKELFDDLAAGAYSLYEELFDNQIVKENWDDMAVALLGETHRILGYDDVEMDYFKMFNFYDEDAAVDEAIKRLKRLTKDELIFAFQKVLRTLVAFFDLKASHDCLTAVIEELDNRGAILNEKNNRINQLYEDLTGRNGAEFDELTKQLPQRMWVE